MKLVNIQKTEKIINIVAVELLYWTMECKLHNIIQILQITKISSITQKSHGENKR